MNVSLTTEWFKAAGVRALRTMAQTMIGFITVGAALGDINWLNAISVSATAAILSVVTSLATNLPEVITDGTLQIDAAAMVHGNVLYSLELNESLATVSTMQRVSLKVDPTVHLEGIPYEQGFDNE